MANVPSILLLGDYMVQGGAPGVLAGVGSTGLTELEVFGDLDVLRITPSDASTGAPTAASVTRDRLFGAAGWIRRSAATARPIPAASSSTDPANRIGSAAAIRLRLSRGPAP